MRNSHAGVNGRRHGMRDELSRFGRWLCDSLDQEATAESTGAGGAPVTKPVCLTEVEAVGLLVLALDAEANVPFWSGLATRLAARLRAQLEPVL
jgi:hypothetical protein